MADFTTHDGCRIAYTETGSGEDVVVVLTGWSQSAAMFDRVVPHLAQGRRVVTMDYRNHGRSGDSEGGARVATLAADYLQLLDHLGIEKAHAMGHSMGCSVLWSHIDQHGTSRLASVVLIDQPTVCALVPWLASEQASEVGAILDFAGAEGFVAAILGPDADAARAAFLTSMLTVDMGEEDRAFMLAENMRLPMPFGARLLLDHVMQDWRDVLPRIDVPALVVGGEVSHVDATSQRWIADQIPGAALRVFTREEGGAHFPFFEGPETFSAAVEEFWGGVAGR